MIRRENLIADLVQMIMAAVLLFLMFGMPESPGWHLLQAHLAQAHLRQENFSPDAREKALRKRREYYNQAFLSLCDLRHTRLQAARDLFLLDRLIGLEMEKLGPVWKTTRLAGTRLDAFLTAWNAYWKKLDKIRTDSRCR